MGESIFEGAIYNYPQSLPPNDGTLEEFYLETGPSNIAAILVSERVPIGSMYGIFTYIYHKNQPNVGKYAIHGSYGV